MCPWHVGSLLALTPLTIARLLCVVSKSWHYVVRCRGGARRKRALILRVTAAEVDAGTQECVLLLGKSFSDKDDGASPTRGTNTM